MRLYLSDYHRGTYVLNYFLSKIYLFHQLGIYYCALTVDDPERVLCVIHVER